MKKFLCVILSVIFTFGCFTIAFAEGVAEFPVEKYFSANGSHSVKSIEFDSGKEKYSHIKIWYPADMEIDSNTYPVIIYCNGTGTEYEGEPREAALMEYIATWGFIAVANNDIASGNGDSASESLDFLLKLNDNKDSVFYNKVNKDIIGLSGHSQGGSGVFNACSEGKYENSNMFKALYGASTPTPEIAAGAFQNTPYDSSRVKIPCFLSSGTGLADNLVCPLEDSLYVNMNAIQNTVVIAQRKETEHGDMIDYGKAYMMAWFYYTLLGDDFAATAFTGDEPEIFVNTDWTNPAIKENGVVKKAYEPKELNFFEKIAEMFHQFRIFMDAIIRALESR